MITIKIDNIDIQVPEGTTLLKAAKQAGINIPSMCLSDKVTNHQSCMVCIVKNNRSGAFYTSCSVKAENGMEIISEDNEILEMRRNAVELLLSDHVGDCQAPCQLSCPAHMNIPEMNRLIQKGKFEQAYQVVKRDIALPYLLGYICHAPCEKACRRAQADSTVSICLLKRFVAANDAEKGHILPVIQKPNGKKIAVIGAGLTGLSCAYHLALEGYKCTVFDKNSKPGGALLKEPKSDLPEMVMQSETDILINLGIGFRLNYQVSPEEIKTQMQAEFDGIIIAAGKSGSDSPLNELLTEGGNRSLKPSVIANTYACGSFVKHTSKAISALAVGKEAAKTYHSISSAGFNPIQKKRFNSRFGKLTDDELSSYMQEASDKPVTIPEEKPEWGYSVKEAQEEAARCMRCDCRKTETCKLRICADQLEANQRAFSSESRKNLTRFVEEESAVFEPEKCIRCGACIKLSEEKKDIVGLSFFNRGFDIFIGIPFGKSIGEALGQYAQEFIAVCPTGAISSFHGEQEIL